MLRRTFSRKQPHTNYNFIFWNKRHFFHPPFTGGTDYKKESAAVVEIPFLTNKRRKKASNTHAT
jgi:hypothetical protein